MSKKQDLLNAKIRILESLLNASLSYSKWHKHISVYVTDESGSQLYTIASGDTIADCIDQLQAAIQALYYFQKNKGA